MTFSAYSKIVITTKNDSSAHAILPNEKSDLVCQIQKYRPRDCYSRSMWKQQLAIRPGAPLDCAQWPDWQLCPD